MKDFALDLNGCSKADRKEVIKLAKSVGYKWDDEDRFKSSNFVSLRFDSEDMVMWYSRVDKSVIKKLYQMPQDMPKLKEALGVDVPAKSVEVPKDGEIYKSTSKNNDFGDLFRYKNTDGNRMTFYSSLEFNGKFDKSDRHYSYADSNTRIEATPEEEAKLIEAEHKNGYHWDGKELVKIPEYVYSTVSGRIVKVEFKDNWIREVNNRGNIFGFEYTFNNDYVSTREAYEDQEAKKKLNGVSVIE